VVLTAEQQWKVATAYESAAADTMGVPPQQRVAFARKARWFRTLARITAKKEAAAALKKTRPQEAWLEAISAKQGPSDAIWIPKAQYQTLAERLQRMRAAVPVA
jgi:hypothetical protein